MTLQQAAWVKYACGCTWYAPSDSTILPGCPDHWRANGGMIKVEPEQPSKEDNDGDDRG